MPASEETFEQLVERVLGECYGKNMLMTDVVKKLMRAIAKKLDEDLNGTPRER